MSKTIANGHGSDFADTFFFAVTTIVLIMSFIDWMLGEEKRSSMREHVGEWYLHAHYSTYGALMAEDAITVKNWFTKFFGHHWLGARRILTTMGLSISITLFLAWLLGAGEPTIGLSVVLAILMVSAVADWLSLTTTIKLLGTMARKPSVPVYFTIFTLDTILSFFYWIFKWLLILFVEQYLPMRKLPGLPEPVNYPRLEDMGFELSDEWALAASAALITTLLPTLIHTAYAALLAFNKAFGRLIRGPVTLILLRVYESKQGVLTLASVAIGAAAKVAQQSLKIFFN